MILDRRKFLKTTAVAGAGLALSGNAALDCATTADTAPGSFDFVFFTDTHIEPELDAAHGCDMCFRKIAGLKPEFAIMGGDHVYDALSVDRGRATTVFDLYKKTEQALEIPLYHTIGNHDVFGVVTKSGVAPSDPGYGKKMFEDLIGRTYYSFDHKGWHFVVLDSIQPTDDRMWEARIDDKQLAWLSDDLGRVGPKAPVIGVVHVPLVTAFATYAETVVTNQKYNTLTVANAPQVLAAFEGHNVVAVLQGHTHVNELVEHKNTRYITNGAVCGNWWHGLRMGFPEGFTMVSLRDGGITTRYETYGFKSVDPREKF
jgi:3',5'-cyclic-AMP phosphodiesterase